MMGSRQEAQGALFYEFRLDDHVPADHPWTHKPSATPAMSGAAMGQRYSHLSLEERCRLRGMMEMG